MTTGESKKSSLAFWDASFVRSASMSFLSSLNSLILETKILLLLMLLESKSSVAFSAWFNLPQAFILGASLKVMSSQSGYLSYLIRIVPIKSLSLYFDLSIDA